MGTKTSPEVTAQLQQYKSHKIVAGAEILSIDKSDIKRDQGIDTGNVIVVVKGKDGEPVRLTFSGFWFQRNEKELIEGNYVVVYSDGYTSISPTEAFVDGYTEINEDEEAQQWTFDSEDAILARADEIRAERQRYSVSKATVGLAVTTDADALDALIAEVPDEKTRAAMAGLLSFATAMAMAKEVRTLKLDEHDPNPPATIALLLEEYSANTTENVKKVAAYAKHISEALGNYLPYAEASAAGSAEIRNIRLQILDHFIRKYIEVLLAS